MNHSSTRRKFLRNTVIAGSAIAVPGLVRMAKASNPVGSLTQSPYFDMNASGAHAFTPAGGVEFAEIETSGNTTKLQSFGFDHINQRLYVLQCRKGDSSGSSVYHGAHGDLMITQLDYDLNILGTMYLYSCGHGISIGVEPQGAGLTPYLWTECGCPPPTGGCADNPPVGGASCDTFGTHVCRFLWSDSASYTYGSSSELVSYSPIHPTTGATGMTCHVDYYYQRMVIRYYNTDISAHSYKVFALSDFIVHDYDNPLISFDEPYVDQNTYGSFQGYAIWGEYLYMLFGDSGDCSSNPNAYVAIYWVNSTSTSVDTANIHATNPYTIRYREPEGMAVYLDSSVRPSSSVHDFTPKLCLGLGGLPTDSETYPCTTVERRQWIPNIGTYTIPSGL